MPPSRNALAYLPSLLRTITKHYIFPSQSQHTQSWGLRTLITITLLRLFMADSFGGASKDKPERRLTIEQLQEGSIPKNPEIADDAWYVPYQFEVPWKHQGGIDVRDPNGSTEIKALEELLDQCIKELALDVCEDGFAIKGIPGAKISEEGESGVWVGYRDFKKRGKYTNTTRKTPPEQRWENLIADAESIKEKLGAKHRGVIMFLHGGAYIALDPDAYVQTSVSLSKVTGMPVLLPRYRLSPQAPFPLALLDAIVAYLYLLYPPVGSLHAPYSPSEIFVSGDSAGGGLALALTQFLTWFNHPDKPPRTIAWSGAPRTLPIPSGLMLYSASIDLTRCLRSKDPLGRGGDSEITCQLIDILPGPDTAFHPDSFRPSPALPTPKRRTLYSSDESTIHPLVSPITMNCAETASSSSIFPPTYLSIGEECFRDANFYLASILLKNKVPLKMEYFRLMPHDFQKIIPLPNLKPTLRSLKTVGEFVLANTTEEREKKDEERRKFEHDQVVVSCARAETIGTLSEEELGLNGLTREELLGLMKEAIEKWKKEFNKQDEHNATSAEAGGAGQQTAVAV